MKPKSRRPHAPDPAKLIGALTIQETAYLLLKNAGIRTTTDNIDELLRDLVLKQEKQTCLDHPFKQDCRFCNLRKKN